MRAVIGKPWGAGRSVGQERLGILTARVRSFWEAGCAQDEPSGARVEEKSVPEIPL